MTTDESEAAKEDLWLTYQNYDPAVKQAVRRLGALPGNNVEEFRNLLLASRERKRAKEFEADVVRRLQGEAFVDDDVLQQTLIVLHAENPGLAEEFKKFVAANGRPDDIDLTVARLRSGTDDPVMPERIPRKPRETPIMSQLITPELAPEPVAEAPEIAAPVQRPTSPPSAPVEEKRAAPVFVASPPAIVPANDVDRDEEVSRGSWTKRVAAVAAVLLIAAAGYFVLAPKSNTAFEATDAPLRQAAIEDKASASPGPAAGPAPAVPADPGPTVLAQPAPSPTEAQNEAGIPLPPPVESLVEPAPEATQEAAPANNGGNGPVPGSRYRVVRGDRLSAIAQQAYGDPSLYPMIQRANPAVRDADLIYSDQVITLPPRP